MAVSRSVKGLLAATSLAALALSVSVGGQQPLDLPPGRTGPAELCGTGQDRLRQLGLRPLVPIAVGQAISYRQEPPLLTSDYSDMIALREVAIAGDIPTVRFKPAFDGSEIETWTRASTSVMNGRLVSLFEASWPSSVLNRVLIGKRWGWDQMGLYWGELLTGTLEPGTGHSVYLRMAPTTLPHVQVWRPAADVQYSSHVVNLVIPGFGDGFIDDDHGFDLAGVASRFYGYFADSYDSVAVVPDQILFANYGAFHRNVQNAVRGIGLEVFDFSAAYGSRSRRLRSVELFNAYFATRHVTSAHEIAHQWGAYIDWSRLSGLPRAGHQPASHDPLWADGETLIGSVLTPFRRVARGGASGWQIEQTPTPVRFHPYSLYAMGHISSAEVPEIMLFDQQDQFDLTTTSTPDPGTPVNGSTRSATVFNVIGMLGERSGPVDTEWHRATVVVTRDRLLTEREMDYWTFAARRLEDPNHRGVVGYDGAGSFEVATGGRMRLLTDIRPLSGAIAIDPFEVDYPSFGQRDWRDVVFDTDVASHYHVGDRVRWTGVVTARDRSDFNQVLIRLWRANGTSSDSIRASSAVSSQSSFLIETQFEPGHRGTYLMEVFLFWPGSGSQYSRAALSPIVIE